MRILIVEDNIFVGEIYLKKFESISERVDLAQTLDEARDYLSNNDYDWVVLDLMMAGECGCDLLEDIKKKTPTPSVIVATNREISKEDEKFFSTYSFVVKYIYKSDTLPRDLLKNIDGSE